jgi:hypothetical protein
MKVRSKSQFLDLLQEERAWRRKELTNVKALVFDSRAAFEHTITRAAVLLLYSHWEGYIKKITELFFHYLNFKGFKYSELSLNFKSLGILGQFEGDFPHKQFSSYLKATEFITTECESIKFKLDIEKHIDTKSNLSTDVIADLTSKLGINPDVFIKNKYHIDSRLLKYRNAIAHGERTDNNPEYCITREMFYDLYSKISNMMDQFEALVINHIEVESYKLGKSF